MLQNIRSEHVIFMDIETVPQYASYADLPEQKRKFWDKKATLISKSPEDTPEKLYERAGIYAEFGKIVCISSGLIKTTDTARELHIKSFYGSDEKQLLEKFSEVLLKLSGATHSWYLCAHNGREFDFPYISRRLLVNGMHLPPILDIRGKFPRDIPLLDTMELWKFGDYKHFVSLDLLADIFDIPSPKDDMDGSQVYPTFYIDQDIEKIRTYCQKDVLSLARLFLKYKNDGTITDEAVKIV